MKNDEAEQNFEKLFAAAYSYRTTANAEEVVRQIADGYAAFGMDVPPTNCGHNAQLTNAFKRLQERPRFCELMENI